MSPINKLESIEVINGNVDAEVGVRVKTLDFSQLIAGCVKRAIARQQARRKRWEAMGWDTNRERHGSSD
ncbi:hypothetical protein ACI0FM_08525 [Paenochrobactrum sp. BZR 588]|uniref:hypothetical protein n=1 Tax=unclassified Paenochrobactrum TaxID=2639760 RepID=UPI00385347E6